MQRLADQVQRIILTNQSIKCKFTGRITNSTDSLSIRYVIMIMIRCSRPSNPASIPGVGKITFRRFGVGLLPVKQLLMQCEAYGFEGGALWVQQ